VAFNGRNPHRTQQQEPLAWSPGGPQTKNMTGHKEEHGQANHSNDFKLIRNSKKTDK
jgi:hypothetical protein